MAAAVDYPVAGSTWAGLDVDLVASELRVAAVAEMVPGAWQLANLKDHVAGGAEVVESMRPLAVPVPVVVTGFVGATQ